MTERSLEDLARLARRRGWSVDERRLRVILPEVQALLDAAQRLRELPIEPGAPMDDPDAA